MKEYIVRIEDSEKDFDEMFVGYIRNCSAEFVRCKDCKYCHYPMPRKWAKRDEKGNLIGFEDLQYPPYCDWWNDCGDGFDVEENDFCSHAERKD